jgi:hypothetical protein
MQQQRQDTRLRLSDRPLRFVLDGSPREVKSNFGTGVEYLHKVNDGQNEIYLPPDAQAALDKAGAQAGDEVEITRHKDGRTYLYKVWVIGDAHHDEPPPAPAPIPIRDRFHMPAPAVDWNPPAGPAAHDQRPQHSEVMTMAVHAALRVAKGAGAYATQLGMAGFQFSEESVRAMAITMFLENARKQGGR